MDLAETCPHWSEEEYGEDNEMIRRELSPFGHKLAVLPFFEPEETALELSSWTTYAFCHLFFAADASREDAVPGNNTIFISHSIGPPKNWMSAPALRFADWLGRFGLR